MHWLSDATVERENVQKRDIYQSLWGMELCRPGHPENSKEETFSMIADAGFAGACMAPILDLAADQNLGRGDLARIRERELI